MWLRPSGVAISLLLLLGACANTPIELADGPIEETPPSDDAADDDTTNSSELDDDAGQPDESTDPPADEPTENDAGQGNAESATTAPPATPAITDLAALLPTDQQVPPQLSAQLSYSTLAELQIQRESNPPIERCGSVVDPTSVAIESGGESAGQRYDYADGVRTATVQIWLFEDVDRASRAMDTVADLRCDRLSIGSVVLDGIDFEQTDSASETPPPERVTSGATRGEAAHFERELISADDALMVVEDMFFEQFGPVVVFTGSREIGGAGVARAFADTATMVLHRRTAEAVMTALGLASPDAPATSFESPSSAIVGIDITAGLYRAGNIESFCVARRLTHPTEELAEVLAVLTWGPGEQGVLRLLASDGVFDAAESCGLWEMIDLDSSLDSTIDGSGTGTLIVGVDVEASSIKVTSVGDCTVRLLSGFGGSANDLVEEILVERGDEYQFSITTEVGVYLSSGCQR